MVCDVVLEVWNKGVEVIMVICGEEIYFKVKYWICFNIENCIKEGSIIVYFNMIVIEIREREVDLLGFDGFFIIENDFVLVMIGYKFNYILFENLGLDIFEDEECILIYDFEILEILLLGVYLVGVVCVGMCISKFFIENIWDYGDVIMEYI